MYLWVTTIRKRRLFFEGGVARQNEGRLRVGDAREDGRLGGRRPGGQPKRWHRCLIDDLKAFDATKGSTEHSKLVFGVEAEVRTVAAKKAGKRYRGVLESAERFMDKWHENEATLSRNRHASDTGGAQGKRKGGGNSRRETAVG